MARTENTEGQAATDNEVRRAYLTLKHNLTSTLTLKVQADVSEGDLDAKDVYLQWQDQDGNAWYMGQFKQFYCLDTLTSDNNITFLERALPTTLSIDRRPGLGTRRHFSEHHLAISVYGGAWTVMIRASGL